MRNSKGRKIETNSGARVSVLAVIALVFMSMIIAIPASADSTAGDPDLIVTEESYGESVNTEGNLIGDLYTAVSSKPENTEHNTFPYLQVTVLIDGVEVDSHIEPIINEHYYYPVPLYALSPGEHTIRVIMDYSWKAGKIDANQDNNWIERKVTVGPQAVQNDFGVTNCQVAVVGGVATLTGDVTSDGSESYIITVNADGSKFCEVSGSGAGAFTPQILSDAVGDHVVDLSIAPADSSVVDPNSGNDAVTGLSYTILAPVPTQDLAVTNIVYPGSGNIVVTVENMAGAPIIAGSLDVASNGFTKTVEIPEAAASPYTYEIESSKFNFAAGSSYLVVAEVTSTVSDPNELNNELQKEVSVDSAPIPVQDAYFGDTISCDGENLNGAVLGLNNGIVDQVVRINGWLDDDGPKCEIVYYQVSCVDTIDIEESLLGIYAKEDLYGTHTLHLEVVAPFDSNGANNFAEVEFTCTEDPAPSFDMNLFKLEEVTPIQLKGTIKFEGGTLPESAAAYVNDMRIGDSFTDNGDGTFSFLVTPQRYASGTDFKISVLSFVAEENMDNNHQLWTAPSSAVVIEQANAYYCGGDTKVRSLTIVTGNTLSSAAYHISIYDKDGKCVVNDKVIGGPSKIPVGTAYRYMNIQKYVNDLGTGTYQAKLWVLDKSGLKSNVYEFEIKIQKPQSKNLALTFAKFQCGSFKMGVGAKDGGVVPSDTLFTVTINGKTKVYSAGSDLSECLSYKQLKKDFGLCDGKVYSFKVTASSKKCSETKKLLVDNTKTGTFKFKK